MNDNPVLRLGTFKVPESNVFLMTRFRQTPYHEAISQAVAEGVRAFGLELVIANNPNLAEHMLWTKVKFCLEACHFGIAIFEVIDEADFNPNVSLELGYMMALQREFLLLKEKRLRNLPTDLCGHLYKEFDSFNIRPTILGRIADWLKPIRVRKLDSEKLIVYVSYGGIDRCAIAKAITHDLLTKSQFTLDCRIESRAAFNPSVPGAAKTAIEIEQSRLGSDWLSRHRPRRADAAFLFEADLILASDDQTLSKLRDAYKVYPGTEQDRCLVRDEIQQKSHLISTFFGGTGDIDDPYPDHGDAESRRKYNKCFDELHFLISKGLLKLTEFLERGDVPRAELRTISFGDRTLFGTTSV